MIKYWLTWINLALAGLIFLVIVAALCINWWRISAIPITELPPERTTLPKNAFEQKKEDYDAIGPPVFNLEFSPITLQLPDLRNFLIYYGRNERPDSSPEESMLHFSIMGSKDIFSVAPDKPLYLVYDKDAPRIKYRFSPKNGETSLWIEASPGDKEATINVAMKNETGEIIRKPEAFSQFKLKEREYSRVGAERWEIGKWNVDGTLLARQRARWFGKDVFLEKHGGEEYKNLSQKQRIEFGQDDGVYFVFVGLGDALLWKNDKWVEVKPGPETRSLPLLVVQGIDDRIMKLELWDAEGKSKVPLNMIRSVEPPPQANMIKAFKFVGARTRSQLMFEVNNERILVGPKDWFLFVDNQKWVKLVTPESIDNYVSRKTVGPLFVVDEIIRNESKQVLLGTLFNPGRTDMVSIEIPLQQTGPSQPGAPGALKKDKSDRGPPASRVPVPPETPKQTGEGGRSKKKADSSSREGVAERYVDPGKSVKAR